MQRIGIVGHIDNIRRIQLVIDRYFPDIQGEPVDIYDMRQVEITVRYLREHIADFDGIIFTGQILYDIMNHRMHSQNPWVHLDHDQSQLQRVLLEALVKHSRAITRISIDAYSEEMVSSVYRDIGLEPGQYEAGVYCGDLFQESLIEDLVNFHTRFNQSRADALAITSISAVYSALAEKGVPCALLVPGEASIRGKLHDLLLKIRSRDLTVSQIVVISLEIDLDNEYDLTSENEYSIMIQKTRITDEVYKFAQRIQAAVIENEKSYLMFTTRQILEFETGNLREMPLLGAIAHQTHHTVSAGIGFGTTAREAKSNAVFGKNKALTMGGNQCFVVYDRKHMDKIGPVSRAAEQPEDMLPQSFRSVADQSGISINSVYRLKCIIDLYKKDTFTSYELAQESGNSLRGMNRMLEKLERAGYAEVIGSRIVGKAGRPSRIIKLKL